MGGEYGSELGNPIVYEGLRVVGLVGGNEVQGFSDEGEAVLAWWEMVEGAAAMTVEEEEEGEDQEEEGEVEREE